MNAQLVLGIFHMARPTKRQRSNFLSEFELDERLLRREEKKSGRPSLVEGYSKTDSKILVKSWSASKNDNNFLKDIWHHEIRQLHRICGYPGANDIIAPIYAAGADSEGFHLALDVGQRRPLATIVEFGDRNQWLKQTNRVSNRIRLWRNMQRICRGIEIIHQQGLIHRNIDEWSVLTSGGEHLDFQLTGFEWSIRLTGVGMQNGSRNTAREDIATASFYSDWRDFSLLISDLLRLDKKKILDATTPPSSVSENILTEEAKLLRKLAVTEKFERVDGEVVFGEIDEIIACLERSEARIEQKLRLAVRLGPQSVLSEAIRVATDGEIESSNIQDQIAFIEADIYERPRLLMVKADGNASGRLVVCGHLLTYSLSKFTHSTSQGDGSWDLAYCERTEKKNPAPINILAEDTVPSGEISIVSLRDANRDFPRLRGKLRSWLPLWDSLSNSSNLTSSSGSAIEALSLTSFLDAIYAAADSFPVEVQKDDSEVTEDLFSVRVKIRQDIEREALSEALGLKPLTDRLDELVQRDSRADEWVISDGQLVGVKETANTTWRLTDRIEEKRGISYRLSGSDPIPPLTQPLLLLSDFVGRDAQFQRRVKAISALKEHSELSEILEDPRSKIRETHEAVYKDDSWESLDPSKQEALERIVSTLPISLVQGPPGVGKTRLVRDLTDHIFRADPTSRVLLTAQANSAIDHLMDEILSEVSLPDDCLIVRPRAKDYEGVQDDRSPRNVTRRLIADFCESDIAKGAPDFLKSQIEDLRGVSTNGGPARTKNSTSPSIKDVQSIEHLVLRSANVVFSTVNSSSIERLVEERNQFDWSVIEEAGKANGLELLAPLLLSHRRLMIGDHKQLAPFDAKRLERVLRNSETVRKAISAGSQFVGRSLRDQTIDEVIGLDDKVDFDLDALCSKAIRLLSLFETLIDDQLTWQKTRPKSRKLASVLNQQHRMHPAIARVVSKTFYDGELETYSSATRWFESVPPPFRSRDIARLPNSPLVLVNMPYVQSELGKKYGDQSPTWHNPDEVSAVIEVLKLLEVPKDLGRKPTIAVLSPYSEQVRRLGKRIDDDLAAFPNLHEFIGAVDSSICGTVDSFQGNQADIVIVSLVRNNNRASMNGALGFLCDARRMNVLFSRARWKLVVVGSFDFLTTVLTANKSRDDAEGAFLSSLMTNLDAELTNNNAAMVNFKTLCARA
ncbi:AAA domain-containing protein [Rhodobacter capsulatus]|uniref:AAA domain-containing protein n=1 Tax=Rhodobacter capsulatus TaxID=1061 RepID=UPI00402891BB